jgi:hypothetical protein
MSLSTRFRAGRVARIEKELILLESMSSRLSLWAMLKEALFWAICVVALSIFIKFTSEPQWSTLSVIIFSTSVALFAFLWSLVAPVGPTSSSGIAFRIFLVVFFFDPFSDTDESKKMNKSTRLRHRIERAIAKRKRLLGLRLEELRY